MRRLVVDTEVLDINSTYTYLLMATDFAGTTIVADRDGDLCGLITGYHPRAGPRSCSSGRWRLRNPRGGPDLPRPCSTLWWTASGGTDTVTR